VIAADGERKAAFALKEASDTINESSSALQLRYLQTLSTISAEKNSTIIFPLPIEFLSGFMSNGRRGGGGEGRGGGGVEEGRVRLNSKERAIQELPLGETGSDE